MATIYSAPEEVGPAPSWQDYDDALPIGERIALEQADEAAYVQRIVELAKQNGDHPLLGVIYRVPKADGYAQYVVWNTKPLELIHLDIGDAWHMSDAEARGTRLSDIQKQVDWEKRWAELVSTKKEGN